MDDRSATVHIGIALPRSWSLLPVGVAAAQIESRRPTRARVRGVPAAAFRDLVDRTAEIAETAATLVLAAVGTEPLGDLTVPVGLSLGLVRPSTEPIEVAARADDQFLGWVERDELAPNDARLAASVVRYCGRLPNDPGTIAVLTFVVPGATLDPALEERTRVIAGSMTVSP